MPRALVDVAPAELGIGSGVDRRLEGLVGLPLVHDRPRLRKPRAKLGGGRALPPRGPASEAAHERYEPERTDRDREEAPHGADATLPRLLATPIAPSPEAAPRRRGRLSPREGRIRTRERIRDSA